jgi:hypothetical protein
MKALAERGVQRDDVARVMGVATDEARAMRLIESLVRDGLVVVEDGICRLA